MPKPSKPNAGALAMPVMVLLVGLAAFGLGRLSVLERPSATSLAVPHTYVGSKTGSVYYLPSCKGAQGIAEQNKVWFASKADAEAAGYTSAASCPGLH